MRFYKQLILFLFSLIIDLGLQAAEKNYPAFNFSDWPQDVITPLIKKYPELQQKSFTSEELDILLKKVNSELPLDELKIVSTNSSLYLIGHIKPKIDSITFKGLDDLDSDEALEIMNISLADAENEKALNPALSRLQSYFKNSGYRNIQITTQINQQATMSKELIVNINAGKKTTITNVTINGLKPEESKQVVYFLNWNGLGRVLTDTQLKAINSSIRSTLNMQGYYLVQVPNPQIIFSADEKKARLVYNLAVAQKYQIKISGQKSFGKSYLENEVLKLNEFYSVESNFSSELVEKIAAFYKASGYAYIDIIIYEKKADDLIEIHLDINEGPYVKIHQLSISGLISRPEKYYKDLFYKLASNRVQDKQFIKADIELASKNLITQLKNEGFVNAKLTRLQVGSITEQSQKGLVVLQIEEGLQTQISQVNIQGNRFINTDKVLELLDLKIGQKLNLYDLEKSINNLRVFYAENGFIESKIATDNRNIISYSENFNEASLNINIVEGPQIYVSTIIIEGHKMTHTKLIQTELEFKAGDLLTPTKLEESIARLQRTGHFSTTDIYTLEANTDKSQRTIVVRVAERNPGIFTSGLGVTNENNYTLHGYTGLAYRNIGGWGRGASARIEGQYNPDIIKFVESKITLGYLEPYLFESRARFRLNYTSSRNVSDLKIRKVTVTNQTVWSLEQDFTSHITGIYEVLNISNYVDRGISLEDEQRFSYSREDLVIASTGPTVDIDYRDNIFNPTNGHWSRLTAEYSTRSLGNHNVDSFIRLTGQTTLYTSLSEQFGLIWVNSYRGGYIDNLQKSNFGVPFDKRGFILGGRSTIRGYESEEFFPSIDQIGVNFKLRTFSTYNLIKSEFRFPLWKSESFSGALFYDGGEVSIDQLNLADRYRDSAGIGLRYNTPVGPINLEYARKLDRKNYESDGAFHLSVGVF